MEFPPVVSSPVAILSCGFRQIKAVAASGIVAAAPAVPWPKAQKNNEFFAAG
jgi:hypothetical protein